MKDPIDRLEAYYRDLSDEASAMPDISATRKPRERAGWMPLILTPLVAAAAGYLFLLTCAAPPSEELMSPNPIAQRQASIARLHEEQPASSPRSHLWRRTFVV